MKKSIFDRLFRKKNTKTDAGNGQAIEFAPETNFYYVGVSSRFRLIGIICFIALTVFVAVSLMCNSREITYDNLFYMVKDINAAGVIAGKETSSISYTSSKKQSFAAYKKGVAVLGEHEIEVFTATGRKTLEKAVTSSNPELLSSEKYIMAYDIGGNSVRLYNSFAEIFFTEYENSVYDAALSDSGCFAIVTRTKEHTSQLKFYNNSFKLINDVGRSGYIIDTDINSDGNRCAFAEVTTHNGEFVTVVSVFTPGTEKIHEITLNGMFPYRCQFISSNRLAVIGNDITYIVDTSGKIVSRIYYAEKRLAYTACDNNTVVLIFENDSVTQNYLVRVFNKDGNQLGASESKVDVAGAAIFGDYLFLKQTDSVSRVNLSSGKSVSVPCKADIKKIIPVSDDEVMLCSSTGADYIKFD